MRNIICSPSVALTEILYERFSVTLGEWCRLGDSNTRPTDYKSVALPTELNRHEMKYIHFFVIKKLIFL